MKRCDKTRLEYAM